MLSELIIFEPYNLTLDNEKFILYDSGVDDNNRLLLFSTKNNLKILASQQSHWFIDGTFKSAPHLFTQILSTYAIKYNAVLPLVFVLLQNKSKESCTRVARELLILEKNLSPISILTDFEHGLIEAFTNRT